MVAKENEGNHSEFLQQYLRLTVLVASSIRYDTFGFTVLEELNYRVSILYVLM